MPWCLEEGPLKFRAPFSIEYVFLGTMKIKGTMTHVPLSGGFWGIEAENGRRFRPVGPVSEEFLIQGLPVEAKVKESKGFSIFMWGTDVEVLSIQKLER